MAKPIRQSILPLLISLETRIPALTVYEVLPRFLCLLVKDSLHIHSSRTESSRLGAIWVWSKLILTIVTTLSLINSSPLSDVMFSWCVCATYIFFPLSHLSQWASLAPSHILFIKIFLPLPHLRSLAITWGLRAKPPSLMHQRSYSNFRCWLIPHIGLILQAMINTDYL